MLLSPPTRRMGLSWLQRPLPILLPKWLGRRQAIAIWPLSSALQAVHGLILM